MENWKPGWLYSLPSIAGQIILILAVAGLAAIQAATGWRPKFHHGTALVLFLPTMMYQLIETNKVHGDELFWAGASRPRLPRWRVWLVFLFFACGLAVILGGAL